MLREALSSWEVMSSREMLEAAGRAFTLPPRTVLAGDARVLLLLLPVGGSPNAFHETCHSPKTVNISLVWAFLFLTSQ